MLCTRPPLPPAPGSLQVRCPDKPFLPPEVSHEIIYFLYLKRTLTAQLDCIWPDVRLAGSKCWRARKCGRLAWSEPELWATALPMYSPLLDLKFFCAM